MKHTTPKLPDLKELTYLPILLAAVFLTFSVDFYILNTASIRFPVLLGSLVLCTLLVYLKKRLLKSKLPPKTALLIAAAALILVLAAQSILFPRREALTVSLRAETTGEVCFCNALLDGHDTLLPEISVKENTGWQYRREYDNYVIYLQEDGAWNCLTLEFPVEKAELTFVSAPWSGSVRITTPADDTLLDLRAEEDTRLRFPIENTSHSFTLFERCVYSAGAVLVLWFLSSALFQVLGTARRTPPYRQR